VQVVSDPRSASWVVLAHVVGAAAIGALDAARLGSAGIAAAAIPMFALTGLLVAVVTLGAERAVGDRPWWIAALGLAAPSLIVFVPVASSLFDGAYAQTLPLAKAVPFVLPLVLWLGTAVAVALGRKVLGSHEDLTTRAIVVLVLAGALGGIIWVERHILKTGYPSAHVGATMAVLVLAGLAVRVTRRRGIPPIVGAMIAVATIAGATSAALGSLRDTEDRRVLATFGDQSRDLIGLWRKIVDLDRDGASKILGGGDCDDLDAARNPGALDTPADGIDQDCDGTDAAPIVAEVKPPPEQAASFRDRPDVVELLARTKGMNLLLVSVDALRADVLAPDAPNRDDFPNLTKLLDQSVWFTRAIAPASGTDVSLATLLTGRFDPFQAVSLTLPEALRAGGRSTQAVIPAEVLRYAGETLINRGVDKLVHVRTDGEKADVGDHISAPDTATEGLRAIDAAAGKPWFVWTHFFDVHESHQIKVPEDMLAAVHGAGSDKEHAYRALLRGIDTEVGKLLGELAARGLADKTIVVFMSDHGESLGEDPRLLLTHGKVCYAPLVRIPIAIRIPGVKGGQRTDLVSLVDLAPTLLDLLGIIPEHMPLDGTNLVPALLDAPAELRSAGRAIAIHEQEQWALVEWPYQLLVRPADNLIELYDLEKDPAQKQDLAASQADVVTRLKSRFATFPKLVVDRTPAGRSAREQLARQRPSPDSR
jgi:arylsulfatase A-like enzyme